MGCARQGFNVFNPHGRRHFIGAMLGRSFCRLMGWPMMPARRWALRHVWRDTFGVWLCALRGHDLHGEIDTFYGGHSVQGCRRCCRFVSIKKADQ